MNAGPLYYSNRGFCLIEVLVALTLAAIVLTTIDRSLSVAGNILRTLPTTPEREPCTTTTSAGFLIAECAQGTELTVRRLYTQ